MEMKRYMTLAIAATAAVGMAHAQDLQGSVTVQGQYQPTLRSHSRISPQPSVPNLSLPESQLPVASEGVPALLQPLFAPQQATGWNASKEFSRYPGYLGLGGGSYLDFTGSAGYRFIDNGRMTLGAWLQHNSTSSYKPEISNDGKKSDAHAAKRFDERIGLYGSYLTPSLGTVGIDLTYHLGYFNYYSTRYADMKDAPAPPTQTLNDFGARIWWQSPDRAEGLTWSAEISDRYLGYRRYYAEYGLIGIYSPGEIARPPKENNLDLKGDLGYGLGSGMKVELGLGGNYVHYTGGEILTGSNPNATPRLSSYGRGTFTPAFIYASDAVTARLGVRIDVTGNTGKDEESIVRTEDKFGHTHFAPDVTLAYRKGKFAAQLEATGGVELRTLASTAEIFYYQSPQLLTTVPLYSPLNARLMLNFGSFGGFSVRGGVAYKITDNITPDFAYALANSSEHLLVGEYYAMNLKGFSLQAGASYKYGDVVKVAADLSYQPQNGETGYFNGYDRPRWILDASAEVNPWSTLRFTLGYQYRGVRSLQYRHDYSRIINTLTEGPLMGDNSIRLDDLTDLSLGAEYTFSDRYTLWLKGDNLLGRHTLIVPGMPTQGFALLGGFQILF